MEETITKIYPFRLEPIYVKSIWAGERLKNTRNLKEDGLGICREVCAYKGSESIVADGPYKGMKINDLMERYHSLIMGEDISDQLVRVAYIDAVEDLSIQVHPNEKFAKEVGDYEKSESWYILEAEPGAYITAGVNLDNKNDIRKACENGTIEKYIIKIPVKQGDFALIPAGMLHACGKDMLAIEIGSFGGITYRLYDYGRPRSLDLEKGMKVLDPSLKCAVKSFPLMDKRESDMYVGVDHPLFKVMVIDVVGKYVFSTENKYVVLTCVNRECVVKCDEHKYNLKYTDTLFIPASAGSIIIEGDCRILKSIKP